MAEQNEIANRLNQILSDYQIYYQNLRGFHWNIQGRDFFELHAKFEELYTDAAVKIDELAERILTIEGRPLHSFDDYQSNATITSVKNIYDGESAVRNIVNNLETLVAKEKELKELASDKKDSGTEDLISAFIEEQEKSLWMYKAWLK